VKSWKRITLLWLSIWLAASSGVASSWAASFPDRYDGEIRAAAARWWPDGPDWKWWKAQLYQESLLNPDARSHVGAEGLAQFMPGTWAQVTRELGWSGISPRDAKYAIQAGAYYMAKLRRGWRSPRPTMDRHFLAAASYNAGMGHLVAAQRLCGGAPLYADIIRCLPQVTGKHAVETRTYVERIQLWRKQMDLR
jgi:soluble lytic murein transglycosylase-like protein